MARLSGPSCRGPILAGEPGNRLYPRVWTACRQIPQRNVCRRRSWRGRARLLPSTRRVVTRCRPHGLAAPMTSEVWRPIDGIALGITLHARAGQRQRQGSMTTTTMASLLKGPSGFGRAWPGIGGPRRRMRHEAVGLHNHREPGIDRFHRSRSSTGISLALMRVTVSLRLRLADTI